MQDHTDLVRPAHHSRQAGPCRRQAAASPPASIDPQPTGRGGRPHLLRLDGYPRGCFTPRGRSAARPHSARRRASFGELTRGQAWEELQRRGANIATLPFTGERRTGARFGPTRLERLENDQLIEVETWSDQRSGDALIEALKAPVVARFASFLGQPSIRATLTWTVPDRRITITGKRGDQPFEEVIS